MWHFKYYRRWRVWLAGFCLFLAESWESGGKTMKWGRLPLAAVLLSMLCAPLFATPGAARLLFGNTEGKAVPTPKLLTTATIMPSRITPSIRRPGIKTGGIPFFHIFGRYCGRLQVNRAPSSRAIRGCSSKLSWLGRRKAETISGSRFVENAR
jgi:hypothetical protein